jgi:hypothetical protein
MLLAVESDDKPPPFHARVRHAKIMMDAIAAPVPVTFTLPSTL